RPTFRLSTPTARAAVVTLPRRRYCSRNTRLCSRVRDRGVCTWYSPQSTACALLHLARRAQRPGQHGVLARHVVVRGRGRQQQRTVGHLELEPTTGERQVLMPLAWRGGRGGVGGGQPHRVPHLFTPPPPPRRPRPRAPH